jgi:hypothetical protein
MFQSPLGFFALITNLTIFTIGVLYNRIKGYKSNRAIISQKHILRLEETKIGLLVSIFLAHFMTTFIFVTVVALVYEGFSRLYQDKEKITIVDVAEKGYAMGVMGYTFALAEVEKYKGNASLFPGAIALENDPTNFPNTQPLEASVGLSQSTSSLIGKPAEINSAFNHLVENLVNDDKASTAPFLFAGGREKVSLVDFLKINEVASGLHDRGIIALYFGMEDYNGTQKQNEYLREKLKKLTVGQLKKEGAK